MTAPMKGEDELALRAATWVTELGSARCPAVYAHGGRALEAFDTLAAVIHNEDAAIKELLADAREDLVDTYFNAAAGKQKAACSALRGLMEGLFMALLYRQQTISLGLWSASAGFHMVHQMFDDRHEFCQYFRRLFKDEGYKAENPGVTDKLIFEEAEELYDVLSSYVHKSPISARSATQVQLLVERVFKLFLTFLEREEELPQLAFPAPMTFAIEKRKPKKVGTR